MTLFFLATPDGAQVFTDLDAGKHAAWRTREEAESVLRQVGDRYGPLVVVEREVEE